MLRIQRLHFNSNVSNSSCPYWLGSCLNGFNISQNTSALSNIQVNLPLTWHSELAEIGWYVSKDISIGTLYHLGPLALDVFLHNMVVAGFSSVLNSLQSFGNCEEQYKNKWIFTEWMTWEWCRSLCLHPIGRNVITSQHQCKGAWEMMFLSR